MESDLVLYGHTGKLVFRVFDRVRLKPICSATETSQNIEILRLANGILSLYLTRKPITKALIRLRDFLALRAILFAIYATKVHWQTAKQTAFVMNGGMMANTPIPHRPHICKSE